MNTAKAIISWFGARIWRMLVLGIGVLLAQVAIIAAIVVSLQLPPWIDFLASFVTSMILWTPISHRIINLHLDSKWHESYYGRENRRSL